MKSAQNRRFRRLTLRGPESLEERCLLSGVTLVQDFLRLDPPGSLVLASTDHAGSLVDGGDQTDFQFYAEAGQTVSAVVTPDGPLSLLGVEMVELGVSVLASGPGQPVVFAPAEISSSGLLTLRVSGTSAASFSVDIYRNTALEAHWGDTSSDSPLGLDGTWLEGRGAVAGSTALAGPVNTVFGEDFDGTSQSFTFDNSYGSGAGLWHVSAGRADDGLAGHSPPGSIYFGQAEVAPSPTLEWTASIDEPELAWGPVVVGAGTGSAYYLNDNVFDGNVLGSRISYGPYEQDRSGAVINALQTLSPDLSAKSAVRLGDYVYFTGNSGGVYRTQVANTETPWTSFAACTISDGQPLETLTTDGTRLYASTTEIAEQVHAYSVDSATGAMTLVWSTSGIAGGVRGLDWDASGYLYGADGGKTDEKLANNTCQLYAIEAAAGAVTDMGTITFNGRLYQTVREGNQLFVFDSISTAAAPAGQIYVYDLAGDTELVSTTPAQTWDPPGIGRIFGAAIDNGRMWLTTGGGQTYGYHVEDNVWESSLNQSELTQWTFADESAPLTTPTGNLAGIEAWYHFPPAAEMASLEESQGDAATEQDVTWELVFRPTDFSGTHVLFETGGNDDGTAFVLLDNTLEFRVQDADSDTQRVVKSVTFDPVADLNVFHHVVAAVHPDAAEAQSEVRLYVDGVEVGAPASAAGILADWADGDGAGLGAPNGLFPDSDQTPPPTPFDGDLALLRFYGNQRFNPGQAKANFDALAAPGASRKGNYDTGTAVGGEAATPAFDLPGTGTLALGLDTLVQVEESVEPFELLRVVLRDTATQDETILFDRFEGTIPADTLGQWTTLQADLTPFAGRNVELLFRFDSGDKQGNGLEGWYVDNVRVTHTEPPQTSDVDEYTFSLAAGALRPVDVVLAGQRGADFSGQTLDLLNADGSSLLATAVAEPLGTPAQGYDLAILGFQLGPGDYRVRLASSIAGDYTIVVTDSVALESEPNDLRTEPLRRLNESRAGLGFLSSGAAQLYTTRSSFNTANPGLSVEDFEEAAVNADGVAAFFGPLDAATSSAVFQAGQILAGLSISAEDASGSTLPEGDLAAVGEDFLEAGVPGSKVVGANEAADHTVLSFAPGVFAVGLDIFDLAHGPVGVYVFDSGSNLLLATSVEATDTGAFFGLASNVAIDHIRLESDGIELVDNVAFGVAGVVPQPDGDWYRLAGLEVGQIITLATRTPLDDPANRPPNDLDPELLVVDAAGAAVASDQNSGADGKNAEARFVVSAPGDYFVRVGREAGGGEYVVELTSQSNLDADGNGAAAPLSDGILILRYLFDPQGPWSVDDALGGAATRTARAQIRGFLDAGRTGVLDPDGNGASDPLSDGILILRYLLDPAAAWAVDDAVGPGATRTTWPEIKAYLDQFHQAAGALELAAGPAPGGDLQASLGAAILTRAEPTESPLESRDETARPEVLADRRALDAILFAGAAPSALVTAPPSTRVSPSGSAPVAGDEPDADLSEALGPALPDSGPG